MIFCDTSTLAKLYVPEPESLAVRQRLETEDSVQLSELARTELMAAFHRRLREGKWSRQDFSAVVSQFSADDIGGFWDWLPLESAITQAAASVYSSLSETIFLRSSDCLHLVTALHHNHRDIFTHDRNQASAALALGITPVSIEP